MEKKNFHDFFKGASPLGKDNYILFFLGINHQTEEDIKEKSHISLPQSKQ